MHVRCYIISSYYELALGVHMQSELGGGKLNGKDLISVLESLQSVWGD